jgi:hypothetical protein
VSQPNPEQPPIDFVNVVSEDDANVEVAEDQTPEPDTDEEPANG